jgi:hypothetical protein
VNFGFIGLAEKVDKWTKFETLVQLGILVFAIVAVWFSYNAANTANQIAQNSFQLLNFKPAIYPYSLVATLDAINYSPNSSTSLDSIIVGGSLNMSFVVLTPHAMILNFTYPLPFNFTARTPVGTNDLSTPNPDKLNSTTLAFYLGGALNGRVTSYPEAFVQTGITQVNFTIPLTATFYPNPLWSTMKQGAGTELILGNIGIKLTVYDVQLEQYLPPKSFSIPLTGWVYIV